ncbi:MAG: dimethylmenaquinone methyltransferase [Acidobacteria bacterium]|nr:dimethylmenaquinone methyltransferase [Acidobacteriota bacterium]
MRFLLLLCGAIGAQAQIFTFSKEQMIKYTSQNPFERFEDGRPKAPDALLEKMRGLSVEEVWGVLSRKGFPNQYEGNWRILHPGKKLVGRAVTAQFMPARGDLNEVIAADGKAKGYRGGQNQWVIIDGAIRDLEGIYPIDMAAYFRGAHPAALGGAMLTGVNIPIRVGNTTVVPGDIVFGDRTGVYFIPPHLAEEIIRRAEVTHIHDEWTKSKFQTGKYKSTDLYSSPHDPALRKEYEEYLKKKLAEREGRK